MKFLFHLERDFNGKKDAMFYPHVYGPFEDADAVNAYLRERWPNDKTARFLVVEGSVVGVPANPREKPEHEKRAPGDEKHWTKKPDGEWACNDCGASIMAVNVAHPIHDGPFPGSGSGECDYEQVGYCPNCEKKPSFHGSPIVPS